MIPFSPAVLHVDKHHVQPTELLLSSRSVDEDSIENLIESLRKPEICQDKDGEFF